VVNKEEKVTNVKRPSHKDIETNKRKQVPPK
jgi:hypothetical protein